MKLIVKHFFTSYSSKPDDKQYVAYGPLCSMNIAIADDTAPQFVV